LQVEEFVMYHQGQSIEKWLVLTENSYHKAIKSTS
jgi:hypothetical protein